LGDALHRFHFGENFGEQTGAVEHFEPAAGSAFCQYPRQFIANALGGYIVSQRRQLSDGGKCLFFNFETKACCKSNGAKHAETIFFKSPDRVSDCADEFSLQISPAVNVIEYFAGDWIFKQRVDGEIAPEHILARISLKFDAIGPASVGIGVIAAKCRHFDTNAGVAAH
jgi:hypothetical protein